MLSNLSIPARLRLRPLRLLFSTRCSAFWLCQDRLTRLSPDLRVSAEVDQRIMSLIRLSGSVSRLFRSTGLVRRYCAGPDKSAEDTRKDPNTEESKEDLHEEPVDELNQLYDAVLAQVPKHGWTDESISEAVKGLGWSIASTRMIQRGPVQVVEEFVNRCNKRLAVQLAERSGDTESSDREPSVDKAVYAIRERISMIEPFHDSWARALALQALPQNSPRALRASAMMVDEVAHYSGYREPNVGACTALFSQRYSCLFRVS